MFAKRRRRSAVALLAAVSLLPGTTPPGTACGPWFPRQYLAQGGMSLLETPRFFAEIELKMLARDFPVPFHAVQDDAPQRRMREREAEDFEAALQAGAIRPPEPETARRAHRRMREVIRQYAELTKAERSTLPGDVLDDARRGVFPSEFADYHEGVLAGENGEHAAARAAWERLLARPEGERRYRSVPAAFMIGVLGVVENWDDTPRWFALARELAQRGFPDASGLAAASYRRESEWHRQRGELHAAAEDALRSIAAGYAATECIRPAKDTPEELAKFAGDPLLRRIHTVLLLAEQTNPYRAEEPHAARLDAWLGALQAANVRAFAGAERLAWLCYGRADYEGARRWLGRAPQDSAQALWLTGKLAARDGRRAEALRAFSAATRLLARAPEPPVEITNLSPDENTPADTMAADYGIVAIGAAEFHQALEAFLRGGHWVDAAFVAERLLSIEELQDFVARRPPAEEKDYGPRGETEPQRQTAQLRWLLARRLARAGRYAEARPFFPQPWPVALERYAQALARGRDRQRSAEVRAVALWEAALEARYHGLELLGTETAPDWFVHGGDFEADDPAAFRRGARPVLVERYSTDEKAVPVPGILRAGAIESARLGASAAQPGQRFHYRYTAAGLGWRAAGLLPRNDPRTAAMLNLAGRWLAGRDPGAADRFYQALESRCAGTPLGQQATARRWFVEVLDPAVRSRPARLPDEPAEN